MMDRVLNNILSNAFKYLDKDSPITVSISSDSGFVHVTVTDEGLGMTTVEIQRVFDPFYRADAPMSVKGTGLGMSLVYEIVSAHGGEISIRSESGRAIAVTFSFPR